MKKADLILHPVRFRILQVLAGETLTTQELADQLPDVPKSSIYRHLKLLLAGEIIAVTEARLVNGIQEKTYQLAQPLHLDADDVANLTAVEHMQYFTTYIMNVMRGFADYLETTEADTGGLDLLADRVGYSELFFYASLAEMDTLHADLNAAFVKLATNKPGNGRAKRKFVFINHPVNEKGTETT
ncbi:MAG: helix-turn-helix domain-containing protein [Chloroflexi bacterium]|nr:helix-turn-helix domain-containing protein [Chloroflexota bacterium]MBP7043066.1 helix-turn-helix domain-containing protein [Chloroflexota bacterium]